MLPEDGLLPEKAYERNILIGESVLEEIPDPRMGNVVNFCQLPASKKFSILRTVSCWAYKHHMFIAFTHGDKIRCDSKSDPNCPKDGHYLHNAVMLFDWDGYLVCKYHKMHLFIEDHYDIPSGSLDPIVYYDAPFGRLGFFICADLLYKQPMFDLIYKYQVDSMIFSCYWFNYVPFVTAQQILQGFSIRHNVNLLSSCVNAGRLTHRELEVKLTLFTLGSLASGIFSGKIGAIIYSNQDDGRSKLFIANVPKRPIRIGVERMPETRGKVVPVSSSCAEHRLHSTHMNISLLKAIPIKENICQETCPYSNLCCRLFVLPKDEEQFKRERFVMLFGNTTSGALGNNDYLISQEFCGLAICEDDQCTRFATRSRTEFKYVYLAATMNTDFVYPSVMTTDMHLLPTNEWLFRMADPKQKILVVRHPSQPLMAVTLYGRPYDTDPPPSLCSKSTCNKS